MMGVNHAISGAAVWTAVTVTAPGFPSLGLLPMEPWEVAAGAILMAGAALLADADHPNATVAYAIPGVGNVAAGAVGKLTGGHRHGMHSILAVVGIWFFAGWLETLTWNPDWWFNEIPIGVALASMFMVVIATKVLKIAKSWPLAWLFGVIGGAAFGLLLPSGVGWFQIAFTLGYATHLAGDLLTVQGINPFWPLVIKAPKVVSKTPVVSSLWGENGYFAIPLLGNAGSWRESILGWVMALYVIAGLGVTLLSPLIS